MRIITEILKGVTGNYEINRVVGAIGSLAYILCANLFQGYEVFWRKQAFDVTAYCLAFPGGLAVAVGSIGVAVAIKDKAVASARVTENTNTIPAPPPAGPPPPVEEPQ